MAIDFLGWTRIRGIKASNLTDAQKAFVIKQGEDGPPVAEICPKAGISQATCLNWEKRYAGLMPSEMRWLRELEDENKPLKRIVADLTLYREFSSAPDVRGIIFQAPRRVGDHTNNDPVVRGRWQ